MRFSLVVLIIIGILIIIAALMSIYYYRHDIQDQFDAHIIKYSQLEKDPELEPVDPAIVKAIISVRTNFTSRVAGNDGEKGIMFIPKDGADKFKDFHGTITDFVALNAEKQKEFLFVCPNRNFPNHKDHKEDSSGLVRAVCPVCRSRTIDALFDAEINIRVGTWYLAFINAYLRENIEGLNDEELTNFSIVIFENGLETILSALASQLKESLKSDVSDEVVLKYLKQYLETAFESQNIVREVEIIKNRAEKFRPGLEKKALEMGIDLSRSKRINREK